MTGGAEPSIWDDDGDSRGTAGENGRRRARTCGFIPQIPSLTIARHVLGLQGGSLGRGPVSGGRSTAAVRWEKSGAGVASQAGVAFAHPLRRHQWARGPYMSRSKVNRPGGRFCGFNLSSTGRSPRRERRHSQGGLAQDERLGAHPDSGCGRGGWRMETETGGRDGSAGEGEGRVSYAEESGAEMT